MSDIIDIVYKLIKTVNQQCDNIRTLSNNGKILTDEIKKLKQRVSDLEKKK